MAVLTNTYYIGERVRWDEGAGGHLAGSGRVDSIYEDMLGRLVYRVELTQVRPGMRYALIHEPDIAGRVVGEEV